MKKHSKPRKKRAAPVKKKSGGKARLRNSGPDCRFYLADGRQLGNLLELADALENMDETLFSQHVDQYRNDFAKWVYDVFHDEELAIKLGNSKSRQEHQLMILKHLVRRLSE